MSKKKGVYPKVIRLKINMDIRKVDCIHYRKTTIFYKETCDLGCFEEEIGCDGCDEYSQKDPEGIFDK